MTIYDITQYAPHALAALCFVAMLGLTGPTVQKPSTWHMSLFIIMAFSVFNILMYPIYDYFMSSERLAELGGSFEDRKSAAYKMWIIGYAYMYSFFAALDFFTAKLIRRFSQKGRAAIAIVMAGFIFVNVMTVTDILTTSVGIYDLNLLSFNVLNATDSIYRNYVELIAYLNIAQIVILMGSFREWRSGNVSKLFSGILSFVRGRRDFSGVHIRFADLCYRGHNQRQQT